MHYVILRDDDTNALTPVDWLERLYRPFLERGLPVNLATIPDVRTDVNSADGRLEGYLVGKNGIASQCLAIGTNSRLVRYLLENPGYHIVQHGYHHDWFEFDHDDRYDVIFGLEKGTKLLMEAGFDRPRTFVAPYDKLSRTSLVEVAQRFAVLSTGWFEWQRLPRSWWPYYVLKKMRRTPHWQVNRTLLLSHPGCLLSYHRPYHTMLDGIKQIIQRESLTVLVTHWWEYFRERKPDEPFIHILHETAQFLANERDIRVISFDDLALGRVPVGANGLPH